MVKINLKLTRNNWMQRWTSHPRHQTSRVVKVLRMYIGYVNVDKSLELITVTSLKYWVFSILALKQIDFSHWPHIEFIAINPNHQNPPTLLMEWNTWSHVTLIQLQQSLLTQAQDSPNIQTRGIPNPSGFLHQALTTLPDSLRCCPSSKTSTTIQPKFSLSLSLRNQWSVLFRFVRDGSNRMGSMVGCWVRDQFQRWGRQQGWL